MIFPSGICKVRVDTQWWYLQSRASPSSIRCLENLGQDTKILGSLMGVGVCHHRLSPERENLSATGLHVWCFLLELIWGFTLGWPFWCSYSMKSMDFPLSCSSGCAWSWQQWTLTPFKTTTLYCTSGGSLGGWYFSVATAWILLFLLSSSPGFWRPFNSPLYLTAAHNSETQHCVLCICWHSNFF